ncbi:hypothetical protein [Rhodanobacter sp. Soil772]|uniref:hypothetical protein n=1 Tax=Rhodanobacter sp. Soil772 TaxID=1736406 RepID=UPI000AB1468A|nr:hypothetical protein [Rhodanobacter sp. Soil772]
MPKPVIFAPAGTDENRPSPVDCNLHPLPLHGPDYYVIIDTRGKAFTSAGRTGQAHGTR